MKTLTTNPQRQCEILKSSWIYGYKPCLSAASPPICSAIKLSLSRSGYYSVWDLLIPRYVWAFIEINGEEVAASSLPPFFFRVNCMFNFFFFIIVLYRYYTILVFLYYSIIPLIYYFSISLLQYYTTTITILVSHLPQSFFFVGFFLSAFLIMCYYQI